MGKARWIAAAAAGTAAVAAAAYYLNERNSEKPDYDLLIDEGRFALRAYSAMMMAETVQQGQRETALGNGFRVLADYIFARSRPGRKIAMTSPVMRERAETDGEWRTRCVMPARLHKSDLPEPAPGVTLAEQPARKVAAIRFSGSADDEMLAENEANLREWMAANSLEPAGDAEYAFYNSPFIPGPMRRNEVLIPVA